MKGCFRNTYGAIRFWAFRNLDQLEGKDGQNVFKKCPLEKLWCLGMFFFVVEKWGDKTICSVCVCVAKVGAKDTTFMKKRLSVGSHWQKKCKLDWSETGEMSELLKDGNRATKDCKCTMAAVKQGCRGTSVNRMGTHLKISELGSSCHVWVLVLRQLADLMGPDLTGNGTAANRDRCSNLCYMWASGWFVGGVVVYGGHWSDNPFNARDPWAHIAKLQNSKGSCQPLPC